MRIFNWVHRRFIPKDGLSHQNLRKDEEGILINSTEADTKALLDENANYHGWNIGAAGGILSIGTFGLIKDELGFMINNNVDDDDDEHKEYLAGFLDKDQDAGDQKWYVEADREYSSTTHDDHQDDDDDDDDDEDWDDDDADDENTMMSGGDVEDDQYSSKEEEEAEGEWNPLLYDRKGKGGSMDHSLNFKYYYDQEEVNKKKKRERITLADLFSAESHDDDHHHPQQYYCRSSSSSSSKVVPPNNSSHSKLGAAGTTPAAAAPHKGGLLFVKKKLIPRVKEESRPIQKLHGLMKRMLKRKIHPDINVNVEGGKMIKPCVAATAISSAQFGFTKPAVSHCQMDGDICHLISS